jgi:hypothetical protein
LIIVPFIVLVTVVTAFVVTAITIARASTIAVIVVIVAVLAVVGIITVVCAPTETQYETHWSAQQPEQQCSTVSYYHVCAKILQYSAHNMLQQAEVTRCKYVLHRVNTLLCTTTSITYVHAELF